MKILLSVGYLPKINFANINIEINIARYFASHGIECIIFGISDEETSIKEISKNVFIHKYEVDKISNNSLLELEKFMKKDNTQVLNRNITIKFILMHPLHAMCIFLSKTYLKRLFREIKYKNYIKKLIKDSEIKVIIGFSYPFHMAKISFVKGFRGTKVYYQFDPHGLHETLPQEYKNSRITEEVKLMNKSNICFTTNELYLQYKDNILYKDVLPKINAIDFPTLKFNLNLEEKKLFNKKNINVVYCGTIDDSFRSPRYFLEIIEPLIQKNNNIKLYFIGNIRSKDLELYSEKYSDSIFLLPPVTPVEAEQYINNSDILINISNSITNMVPSKIFEYYSTGKPIINIQKIKNCSSKKYFEKYPLQVTLSEYLNDKKNDRSILKEFILGKNKEKVDKEVINKLFYTNTIEYVGKLLIDRINEVTS